jgi:hypothetical protein
MINRITVSFIPLVALWIPQKFSLSGLGQKNFSPVYTLLQIEHICDEELFEYSGAGHPLECVHDDLSGSSTRYPCHSRYRCENPHDLFAFSVFPSLDGLFRVIGSSKGYQNPRFHH